MTEANQQDLYGQTQRTVRRAPLVLAAIYAAVGLTVAAVNADGVKTSTQPTSTGGYSEPAVAPK